MGVDSFYGITTTTLIVLSSFTMAMFQLLVSSSAKKAENYRNRLSKYSNNDGEFNYECVASAKYDLTGKHDKLKNNFKKISKPLEFELFVLLLVVLISAVSILFVLLHGIYQHEWITTKLIFGSNLVAIVIYLTAFVSFIFRWYFRKKNISQYKNDISNFLTNIKISDSLKSK